MRGRFLHNKVMVAALLTALRLRGYPCRVEHAIRRGQHPRSVDIFFVANGCHVAIEVEQTTARIPHDIAKAMALRVDLLLIVAPNAQVVLDARAAVAGLTAATHPETIRIQVMPLGTALQWIANNCPGVAPQDVISGVGDANHQPN